MKTFIGVPAFRTACALFGAAVLWAIPVHANPILDDNSLLYLGSVTPGTPANPASVVAYVNALLPMGTNTVGTYGSNTLARSGNTFASMPIAVLLGNNTFDGSNLPTSIDVSGWTYISLKYDSGNAATYIFNTGGLTGIYSIPQFDPLQNKFGLSTVTLLNAKSIPDGGATAFLVGLGIIALVLAQRVGRQRATCGGAR